MSGVASTGLDSRVSRTERFVLGALRGEITECKVRRPPEAPTPGWSVERC